MIEADAYFFDEPLNGLDDYSIQIFIDEITLTYPTKNGYNFTGWYQGETKLSDDAETAVVVESASPVPAVIVYEAHFEAI